ncbi:nuclear transport factor 2 family protein [Xanthomonas campestris pv. campestris]|uniref:YybH family protein n=1 Tax=Xanthomonas campestris TaxID=339 RepID=UPI000E325C85|nr:nuclear transport factor 2 family protein [Xanthomonas campestris]MEA9844391.1 nuclear transport factor 2 family protein [Xanthomonas campestris pv. raphani]RFF65478.1 nuclear transport factor 2 family protein [Xanthomonas campestris pv. raphani]WDK58368.1 nuclear transport factor 2 family protein [Xanthomonas campestris pv. campestris]WDK62730.1 nuclear transport factor 2 family protein [Xanthomonas campestris pv. campestris]WDK66766.1 nuclear transport factor 2 family protein [Xanthomonas
MSRSIIAFFVFSLVLATVPLHGQNITEKAKPTAVASVALPPELDRVLRDYELAWRKGDAGALAALFADDGFLLQSDHPPIRGRAAIQAAYEGSSGGALRLRSLGFSAEGNVAYIIGAYGYGDAPGDIGKFTLTLHRAPGKPWLIFSDMDNLNASAKR